MSPLSVFVLFDGGVMPLEVQPLADQGSPIRLVPIGTVSTDVRDSFLSGSLAMYNALQRKKSPPLNTAFAYRLDPDFAKSIYGHSGALAFAIAVMFGMLGKSIPINIGATGAINDIATGAISRVEAIKEKLEFAINHLENGVLFYPHDNEPDIASHLNEIKAYAREKNLLVCPIHRLDEVIDHFYPKEKKSRFLRRLFILFILMTTLFLYGHFAHLVSLSLIERGHYTLAKWQLHVTRYVAVWNKELLQVFQDFTTPLNTEVVFLVFSARGKEEHYRVDMVPKHLSISDQDNFAFWIHASAPVYVYLYQFNADNTVKRLYPIDGEAPVSVGNVATLPAAGVWFNPDGTAGPVTIDVVISRWRCRDLEENYLPERLRQQIALRDDESQVAQVQRITLLLRGTP